MKATSIPKKVEIKPKKETNKLYSRVREIQPGTAVMNRQGEVFVNQEIVVLITQAAKRETRFVVIQKITLLITQATKRKPRLLVVQTEMALRTPIVQRRSGE